VWRYCHVCLEHSPGQIGELLGQPISSFLFPPSLQQRYLQCLINLDQTVGSLF
jgi:hypothetical protein